MLEMTSASQSILAFDQLLLKPFPSSRRKSSRAIYVVHVPLWTRTGKAKRMLLLLLLLLLMGG